MTIMDAPLTPLQAALLDIAQHDFPRCPRPFAELARCLDSDEAEVIAAFDDLKARGILGRIGAVYATGQVGASTLAAMAVPEERLEDVAALVSALPEVNHNYLREDALNLWFVVTAPDADRRAQVLAEIGDRTGLAVLDLPMVEAYHLDLGFRLS